MTVVFLDPQPGANDGFDVEAQYQMVPAGGSRRMGFLAQDDEPEDVIVYCTDPNKAYLWGLYIIQGHAAIQGSGYFVKRRRSSSTSLARLRIGAAEWPEKRLRSLLATRPDNAAFGHILAG